MKHLFYVSVKSNATGETLERFNFESEQDAIAYSDFRKNRESFGETEDRTIQVEDVSELFEKKFRIEDRTDARNFCLNIVDQIAAYNKKYASDSQMQTIFQSPAFIAIILGLLTGGTKTARNTMAATGSSLYPASFMNDILAQMDAYIAKENAADAESEPSQPNGETA